MTITDDSGRYITGATVLATITGPGTLYLVQLSDGSTRLVCRSQTNNFREY